MGIGYKRRVPRLYLIEPKCYPIVWDKHIPKPKQDIDKGDLVCFLDDAYVNDPTKRRSTTVFDFTFPRAAVVYRSKNQSINVLSYTEAEPIAAVTDAKTDRFLRSMLW